MLSNKTHILYSIYPIKTPVPHGIQYTMVINRSSAARNEQNIKPASLHIQHLFQCHFFIGYEHNVCIKEHTSVIFLLIISNHKNLSLPETKLFKSAVYFVSKSPSPTFLSVSYIASLPHWIAKDIFIILMKIWNLCIQYQPNLSSFGSLNYFFS